MPWKTSPGGGARGLRSRRPGPAGLQLGGSAAPDGAENEDVGDHAESAEGGADDQSEEDSNQALMRIAMRDGRHVP